MAYSTLINRDRWAPLVPGWSTLVIAVGAGEGWIIEVPDWAKWARVRGVYDATAPAVLLAVSPKILNVVDPTATPPCVFCTQVLDAEIPIIARAFTIVSFGSAAQYHTIELFGTDACPWNR